MAFLLVSLLCNSAIETYRAWKRSIRPELSLAVLRSRNRASSQALPQKQRREFFWTSGCLELFHVVHPSELPVGGSTSVAFTSSSEEGALLYLPTGADSQDLLNYELFLACAIKNASAWYEYANSEMGWRIGSDSLYLITGCDKTDSWALAAHSGTAGATKISLKLNMKLAEGNASYCYEWENHHSAQGRVSSNPTALMNQCVFG
jgi:hypothetical protein